MGAAMSISSIDYVRCERDPKTLWVRVRLQITDNTVDIAGDAAKRITNQLLTMSQADSFTQEALQRQVLLNRPILDEIWSKYATSKEFMSRPEFKAMMQQYFQAAKENAMNEVHYTVETILRAAKLSEDDVTGFHSDATVREETINKASALEKNFAQWLLESDDKAEQMFLKLTTSELISRKSFTDRWANVLEETCPTLSFKYTMLRTYAIARLLAANKEFRADDNPSQEKVTPGRDAVPQPEALELK